MRSIFWIPFLPLLLSCASSTLTHFYDSPKGLFLPPSSVAEEDPFAGDLSPAPFPEVEDMLPFFVALGLKVEDGARIEYRPKDNRIRVDGSSSFHTEFRALYRQVLIPPTCD